MNRLLLVFLLFLLTAQVLLVSCTSKQNQASADKWYNYTKNEILVQSNLKSDSITNTYNDDSTYRREHHFSKGHEFMLKGYNKRILRQETHYSKDKQFELRREICDNGNLGFEGIVYQDHFYGLSTWRHCNGKLSEQGIRYKDEKVGVWKKGDEEGQVMEKDYGKTDSLNAMPIITVTR